MPLASRHLKNSTFRCKEQWLQATRQIQAPALRVAWNVQRRCRRWTRGRSWGQRRCRRWTRGRSRPLPGLEALWELIQSQTVKEGAPAILLRSDGWFAISLRKRLIYRRIGGDSPGANSSARKRPQFRVSKHRQSVCSIRHLSFISSHHSNALCPIGVAIRLRSKSRDGHPSPGIHGFL